MRRTLHRLLTAVPAALAMSAAGAADFQVGEIWSAKGRDKDPKPEVLILRIEPRTAVGDVVFVAVGGVKLCLPGGACGDLFSPLAMSKDALDRSVKEVVGKVDPVRDIAGRPQFRLEDGYRHWKDGLDKGARVTVTVPLAEALDQMEGGASIQVK